VFLVHPGGPFWARKDLSSWSIPKGEYHEGEEPLDAAKREFEEETGFAVDGDFKALNPLKQPSGKIVRAWALEGDCDAAAIKSNTFLMEWPPHSGRLRTFPEIDRIGWFGGRRALQKLIAYQRPFLVELQARLAAE